MTSSSSSSKVIKRVWKHAHENRPDVKVDFHGRIMEVIDRNPPYRYVVSYEQDGQLYTQMVFANDELDAMVQFNKENVNVWTQ